MAQELAKPNSAALAAAAALRGNLSKVRQSLPQQNSAYLRFGKDGSWSFGVENYDVVPEDRVALNPLSLKTGFICWTDRDAKLKQKNEVMGEVMYPLGADVPGIHTMVSKVDPVTKEPCVWKEQISVTMRFLDGPDKGKQVDFATTSDGGLKAMGNIIDQLMLQLDEDPTKIVPVLSLDSDSYMHKQWGKTYTPVMKITDWVTMDGANVSASEPADAPLPDDEKAKVEAGEHVTEDGEVIEGTVVPETEAPVEDEAPIRRRRR